MMKPRLFVDMDGTLADFPLDRSYFVRGFFETLRPHEKLVCEVNRIFASNEAEVFLLTNCPDVAINPYAGAEKTAWAARHLPGIPVILLPCDTKKAEGVLEYTAAQVSEKDALLDDYSVNLREWEKAGGFGIKALNSKNGTKGTWTGPRVNVFFPSELGALVKRLT